MSDPLDELTAAPDIISGGGEDFSAFAVSRWPGLVRLAYGLTGDRWTAEDLAQATLARAYVAWRRVRRADDPDAYLRRILVNTSNRRFRRRRMTEQSRDLGLLETVEPPAAPVDVIIRRGRGIRLRRAGAVAASLAVAGIVAGAALLPPPGTAGRQEPPPLPVTVPAGGIAGPGGVFASGTASGHRWRLAVDNIADPGHGCVPAVTVNGTDASLITPNPGSSADVTLGAAAPGLGFAFVQVPNGIQALVVDGRESIPAIAATVCGQHYRLVGLAYRLTRPPQLTAAGAAVNWPAVYQLPAISAASAPPGAPQEDGIWNPVGSAAAAPVRAVLATGPTWSIELILGASGACYDFNMAQSPGSPETQACSPIGVPGGPQTITALPLSYPPAGFREPTGYVVQVSPRTAQLRAASSDGSVQLVTPTLAGGRRYAAFVIGTSLRLERLTWLDASGRAFATSTVLPRDGYTQFRP